MARRVVFFFRRGAAGATNEIVASQSVPGVSNFRYRDEARFPRAHAAVVDTELLDGQNGYGVNKKFTSFLEHWKHPTFKSAAWLTLGTPAPSRSHFQEQNRIDAGGLDFAFKNSGLFNRLAGMIPPATPTPLDLFSIGNSASRNSIGGASAYAASKSTTPLLTSTQVSRAKLFMDAAPAQNIPESVIGRAGAMATLNINTGLSSLPLPSSLPSDAAGAPKYPTDGAGNFTSTGGRFRDLARMIIAGLPSRLCNCDIDGWDHHSDMGGSISSPSGERNHAEMMIDMNLTLQAFMYDLEQTGHLAETLICTISEFNRTMRENGNHGADHGQSAHAYAWGATVRSDLYGAPLDFSDNNPATFADPGNSQSPVPNRLLKGTMDYRNWQRMICEWLIGRPFTAPEMVTLFGAAFTETMTSAQRAGIAIN